MRTRRRWAVSLEKAASSNGPGATGQVEERAYARLLSELTLVEETRSCRTGALDDLRTLLLVGSARHGAEIGMALALGRIRRTDRNAVVGFFPSLQHLAGAGKFEQAVSLAYQVAAQNHTRLILAGTPPRGSVAATEAVVVNPFRQFPRVAESDGPIHRRSLWNIYITVGTVDAFRLAFLTSQPSLVAVIDAIAAVRADADESRAIESARAGLPRLSWLGGASLRTPRRCLVLPMLPG